MRAILFDVGGVLSVEMIDTKLGDLAEKYSLPVPDLLASKQELRPKADLGEIGERDFWRMLLERHGVTAIEQDLDFVHYLQPVEGTLDLARRLSRHYCVAILSNDSLELSRERRSRHGFDEVFDPVIISSAIELVKPDPAIYRHAADAIGVEPDECLFIDDREENVEGARKTGMQAIRFRNARSLVDQLINLGVYKVS